MCLNLVSCKKLSLTQGVPCWWFTLGIGPKTQEWETGMSEIGKEGKTIQGIL